MFQDSWKEEDGKPLSMDDYDGDTVQAFVDFIYDGRLDDKSKLSIQLLAISHFYQVPIPISQKSPLLRSYFLVLSNFVLWFKGWLPREAMLSAFAWPSHYWGQCHSDVECRGALRNWQTESPGVQFHGGQLEEDETFTRDEKVAKGIHRCFHRLPHLKAFPIVPIFHSK